MKKEVTQILSLTVSEAAEWFRFSI